MLNMIRGTVLSALLLVASQALADPVRDLVVAAQIDNPVSAGKLIASGLNPNTVDPLSREPVILVALREGSQGVIDLLLANKDLDLERAAPNGNTALMMAALKQNKAAVKALLARGAAVKRPGWTALHYAAAGGDAEIVTLLADKGSALDAVSPNGMTPLILAASEGHPDAVEVLLKRGADAGFRNKHGQTAREAALYRDRPDIAKMIDEHLAAKK
jgi:uncharacterized protein